MKQGKMNESMAEVLDTQDHPYGFRFDWVGRLKDALGGSAEGGSSRELTSIDVVQAMDCEGLWVANRDEDSSQARFSFAGRQALLTRRLARLWGRHDAGRGTRPFLFVESSLKDPFWMTELESNWLGEQSLDERIELVGEVSAVLCRLQNQIPFDDVSAGVHVGLAQRRVELGNLILVSDDVDFRVRTCEVEGEGAWARTVLLALVPEKPTMADLDRLGFSAAMHTITTGCPPARVAAYGLLDGKVTSLDVDAEWIGLQVGFIMATRKNIERIQRGDTLRLTPGRHCAHCPARQDCPLSRFGLEEF